MFPNYNDITSRISESPTWYTTNGVPRYGDFKPREVSIYARYSTLMEIGCQDCGKRFLIGEDYDGEDILEVLVDMTKITGFKWEPKEDHMWVSFKHAIYAPRFEGETETNQYKSLTLQEIVEGWGFGDPPNHGCIGDTMGSVEIRSVQAWDHHFGQETGPSPHGDYKVVQKRGVSTRIAELEDYKFEIPEWYRYG